MDIAKDEEFMPNSDIWNEAIVCYVFNGGSSIHFLFRLYNTEYRPSFPGCKLKILLTSCMSQ